MPNDVKTLADEIMDLEKWAELGRGMVALADELGLLPNEEAKPKRRRRKRRVDIEAVATSNNNEEANER